MSDGPKHGDLVYFQINVADGERAKAFYGGLFGWKATPGNVPGGLNFEGPSPAGGAFGDGETDSRPLVYFAVDSLEEGLTRVNDFGGEAGEPEQAGPGRYAICKDDQGVEFGLFEFD